MQAPTSAGLRRHWRTGALAVAASGALVGGLAIAPPAAADTLSSGALIQAQARFSTPQTRAAWRAATFAPARVTYTTLSASTTSPRRGASVTLTGSVAVGTDRTELPRQAVRLQLRSGSTWHTVATKSLSGNGSVTFVVQPSGSTTYRLAYLGAGKLAASWSAPVAVSVASATRTTGVSRAGTSVALPPASGRAAQVLAVARAQSGKRYSYGAAGPNAFDCSGLTQFAFRSVGVYLPHNANAQKSYGVAVPRAQAAPGDLIIFLSGGHGYHAGIYAGNGYMVDAPNTGKTVGLHKVWSSNVIFRRIV